MYMESIRVLTADEINIVAAGGVGGSAAHIAFITTAGTIGGAIGARFGEMSGSEFGALLGAALCSPGGPEASSACAAVGGLAGLSIGNVSGRDAGALAAGGLAEEVWQQLFGSDDAAGNQDMAYDPSQAQAFVADLTYDASDNSFSDSEFGDSGSDVYSASDDGSGDWDDPYSDFDADTGSEYIEGGYA